ncbi:MAG: ATP:cob(I)alamin adenosyltransferase [Myxococcales bacterium]|nr:ATP:cob(I)alamin adenosyltransferase [Myxococcales bacterium]
MKVYTRTGDDGTTGLFGGGRVSKSHLRVQAYGTVDELNSVLGVARACHKDDEMERILDQLQHDLFVVGADMATPLRPGGDKPHVQRVQPEAAEALEGIIDRCDDDLEELRNFILPGGTMQAAQLHLARTVCRRAERLAVALSQSEPINEEAVVYLNRLSDLLFVLGRWANARAGEPEVIWNPRG